MICVQGQSESIKSQPKKDSVMKKLDAEIKGCSDRVIPICIINPTK